MFRIAVQANEGTTRALLRLILVQGLANFQLHPLLKLFQQIAYFHIFERVEDSSGSNTKERQHKTLYASGEEVLCRVPTTDISLLRVHPQSLSDFLLIRGFRLTIGGTVGDAMMVVAAVPLRGNSRSTFGQVRAESMFFHP